MYIYIHVYLSCIDERDKRTRSPSAGRQSEPTSRSFFVGDTSDLPDKQKKTVHKSLRIKKLREHLFLPYTGRVNRVKGVKGSLDEVAQYQGQNRTFLVGDTADLPDIKIIFRNF